MERNYLTTLRDTFTESYLQSTVNLVVFYVAGLALQLVAVLLGFHDLPIKAILLVNGLGTSLIVITSWLIYWRWPPNRKHG